MKKIFTIFAAAMMAVSLSAASFGILVNGKMYYAGAENPSPADPSYQEYMVLGLSLKSGDYCQLCDAGSNYATWAVDLDGASSSAFSRNDNKYDVSADGCYDFYIKIKMGADQLYVGAGNCGSPQGIDITGGQGGQGGEGGGQGGGDDQQQGAAGHDFYVMGWINGADAGEAAYDTFDDQYKFVNGKIMIDCRMGSYIGLKDDQANYYYFQGESNATGDNVTLKWANGWRPCQKWAIPEGVNYIIIRKIAFKGNIELQRVDKDTFDAYSFDINDDGEDSAVESTTINANTTKTIINGQVVIIKDGVYYNLLGAQLQ